MVLNMKWKGQIYLKAKKTWQCCHLGRSVVDEYYTFERV